MVETASVPLLDDDAESDFKSLCQPCLMYTAFLGVLILIALLIAFLL